MVREDGSGLVGVKTLLGFDDGDATNAFSSMPFAVRKYSPERVRALLASAIGLYRLMVHRKLKQESDQFALAFNTDFIVDALSL